MLVLVKKVFVSLEVSQKLKAMKNDWYFIGFYKVWWLLKKSGKTAAARTKGARWRKWTQRESTGNQAVHYKVASFEH